MKPGIRRASSSVTIYLTQTKCRRSVVPTVVIPGRVIRAVSAAAMVVRDRAGRCHHIIVLATC